jgi:hypothetical protein
MQLTQAYTRFLHERESITTALRTAGYELEAALLDQRTPPEPWAGQRTHVGPTLPTEANAGDIWMDTVELMPMVLIPFEDTDEPILWLAMRPVARWQFAAYSGQPLDGPELEPVTRVSHEQASLYAQRFGKLTATRVDWQLAKAYLPATAFATLWGPVREWASYDVNDEPGVVEPETVDLEDVPDELIFGPRDAFEDVGFRTYVHLQIGLRR